MSNAEKKLNGEQQKLFYSWGLHGIWRSDFLIVLDLSVTVETRPHFLMHLIFFKNCDLMQFFWPEKDKDSVFNNKASLGSK